MMPDVTKQVRHTSAAIEEWVFAAWTEDGQLGVISGHRIVGRRAWYWAALARHGHPLLHITDFDIVVRADPFIVKGEALWAEHHCVVPATQWSIGNETFASSLDDPNEALGRAYGDPTPIAFDLEWYAIAGTTPIEAPGARAAVEFGVEQTGVVHGSIEILGEATVELFEVPARRWHRWTADDVGADLATRGFGPLALPTAPVAHTGVRAPFAFPDGSISDLVLTSSGWALRNLAPRGRVRAGQVRTPQPFSQS